MDFDDIAKRDGDFSMLGSIHRESSILLPFYQKEFNRNSSNRSILATDLRKSSILLLFYQKEFNRNSPNLHLGMLGPISRKFENFRDFLRKEFERNSQNSPTLVADTQIANVSGLRWSKSWVGSSRYCFCY